MPLDSHGPSPCDLSRGLTPTPKSRGVRKGGDRAAFKYTEHVAFPGSILLRYVCGVGPCPSFLGHQCQLVGGWEGGQGLGWARGSMLRACWGPAGGAGFLPPVWGRDLFAQGQAVAPAGFLCVRGQQSCLQIPLLIPGQGSGRVLPTEALAGCREGILGCFLWKPGWLTRARQELSYTELSAWEGKGAVLQTALASWDGTCWVGGALGRRTCQPPLAFPSSQRASQIPLHILPAMFLLHHSCRLPNVQDHTGRGGELCPEPRRHLRQGMGSAAFNACRGWQGLQIPACCFLPASSHDLPGRVQAGML